ncbi:MAG: hypothetical protein AAFR61_26100 [Bacteroidota bacterium]
MFSASVLIALLVCVPIAGLIILFVALRRPQFQVPSSGDDDQSSGNGGGGGLGVDPDAPLDLPDGIYVLPADPVSEPV